VPPLDNVDRAIQFALRVRDVIATQLDDGLIPRGAMVTQGRCVAALLLRAGRTDEAIAQLRAICDLAEKDWKDVHDSHHVKVLALVEMGTVAYDSGRRDLAQYVLDRLGPFVRDQGSQDPNTRMAIARVRSQLLRLLNRIDEAIAISTAALEEALVTEEVTERVRADLRGIAASLARDRCDGTQVLRHELAILEHYRQTSGKRPSWHLAATLISCADGAIEAKDLPLAVELLTEVEEVARTSFGVGSREYGRYLSVLGRLNLERKHWPDARTDLEAAAAILRRGSDADRTELAVVLVHLGQVHTLLDEPKRASSTFDEAIAIDSEVYGPRHPETLKDILIRDETSAAVLDLRQLYAYGRGEARGDGQQKPEKTGTRSAKNTPTTIPNHVPFRGPTYEPMSGRIQVGVGSLGSITTWRLHQPGAGVQHGLVSGPLGSGRTTALTCILINALHSKRFVVMPTAPSWDSLERATWQKASPYAAEGLEQVSELFHALDQMISTRLEAGGYQEPTVECPAILVTMDDSELMFTNRHIRIVAERLVKEGNKVGIGLVAVTLGKGIEQFGDSDQLRTALLKGNRLTFVEPN